MFSRKLGKKAVTEIPDKNGERIRTIEQQIQRRAVPMFQLCRFALKSRKNRAFPCSEYLRKLNTEATSMEELVDGYGAQKNEKWFPFREVVAAEKLFSAVNYNLFHVQKSAHRYKLLDVEEDFRGDTKKVLKKLKKGIIAISESMIDQAKRCGIYDPNISAGFERCDEQRYPIMLPADRNVRHVYKIGETVVYLATQFLNLSEERTVKEVLKYRESCDYESCIPSTVNEEKCRFVESRFHNLQSLYDTYIFESDMEIQNRNLPYLRGHISVIYHMLQMATDIVHYYIRHMSKLSRRTFAELKLPLSEEELLETLYEYFLHYAKIYMDSAMHLCRSMIKTYSQEKEITAPIPNYRGFHVRPSTLIAKIVAHYGSTVKMCFDGREYNAGVTLELFRANEQINAIKRRYIGDVLRKRTELQMPVPEDREKRKQDLQYLFLQLMNENEIILYDSHLPFEDIQPFEGETMTDLASRCIKHFMSIAKMDVNSDLSITFRGDNRALNDIKVLAENGYGEDKFGNNIVLPQELSYLRR